MPIKVRAPLACRITSVDRDRFNEAVARGDYPGAPPAGSGKTRLFQMHDLIALHVYGRLLEDGVAAKDAGKFAQEVKGLVRKAEGKADAICAVYIKTTHDRYYYLSDPTASVHDKSVRDELELIELVPLAMGSEPVVSLTIWPLGNIRKIIEAGIEDWKSAIGEEEVIG
jgi:hypothetical protein